VRRGLADRDQRRTCTWDTCFQIASVSNQFTAAAVLRWLTRDCCRSSWRSSCGSQLLSRPGSSWRYSSPGYVLPGWIVQQVSGQPYADFLADRIFAPWA
jgi:CubicO group peptidase (beta-lactamase class C family)